MSSADGNGKARDERARPTVVVGVDGSEHSRAALRWAAGEAALRGARLKIVCAWSYPYVAAAGALTPVLADWEGQRGDAQVALESAVAEVAAGHEGLEVETVVVAGAAARVLLDAAEGADLLVVGSRGHGGFAGLLLGSVGQQCVSHAPCPVVVVRGEPAAHEDAGAAGRAAHASA